MNQKHSRSRSNSSDSEHEHSDRCRRGPRGHRGHRGHRGLAGPIGPQGPPGDSSAFGATGPKGPQGPAGQQGETGPIGSQGQQGATGSDGPTGQQGATGSDGPTGPQGLQGATGPQGQQGATGSDGPHGPTGPQGATGTFSGIITGSLIPNAPITYDLGSSEFPFRSLYLSGNTVYFIGKDTVESDITTITSIGLNEPGTFSVNTTYLATGPSGEPIPVSETISSVKITPAGTLEISTNSLSMMTGATGTTGGTGTFTTTIGEQGPTGPVGPTGQVGPTGDMLYSRRYVKGTTTSNLLGSVYDSATHELKSEIPYNFNQLAVDGVTGYAIGDRVLVKNQTTRSQNGVYEITDLGSQTAPVLPTIATPSSFSGSIFTVGLGQNYSKLSDAVNDTGRVVAGSRLQVVTDITETDPVIIDRPLEIFSDTRRNCCMISCDSADGVLKITSSGVYLNGLSINHTTSATVDSDGNFPGAVHVDLMTSSSGTTTFYMNNCHIIMKTIGISIGASEWVIRNTNIAKSWPSSSDPPLQTTAIQAYGCDGNSFIDGVKIELYERSVAEEGLNVRPIYLTTKTSPIDPTFTTGWRGSLTISNNDLLSGINKMCIDVSDTFWRQPGLTTSSGSLGQFGLHVISNRMKYGLSTGGPYYCMLMSTPEGYSPLSFFSTLSVLCNQVTYQTSNHGIMYYECSGSPSTPAQLGSCATGFYSSYNSLMAYDVPVSVGTGISDFAIGTGLYLKDDESFVTPTPLLTSAPIVGNAWVLSRTLDMNTTILGTYVPVQEGTLNRCSIWTLTTPDPVIIGTSAQYWSRFQYTVDDRPSYPF